MEFQVFLNKLDGAMAQLPDLMLNNLTIAAGDSKALIQRRIQELGTNEKGVPFSQVKPYSRKYLFKKIDAGKYRGKVDLTFSTDMWSSVGIVESVVRADRVVTRIGGLDETNKLKMQGLAYGREGTNYKGRGEFLALSEEEIKFIGESIQERWAEDTKNLLL